jgi:sporulation protein YlmC with PRC-barrel domain
MEKAFLKKQATLDKLHNYLRSPLFPWNFLFEPVPEDSLKHFIRWLAPTNCIDEISEERIADELRTIANDYIIDPDNDFAKKMHGRFVHDYPFAYGQCVVYCSLFKIGKNIADVVDVGDVSKLLGYSEKDVRKKERTILSLLKEKRKREGQATGKEIISRKVVSTSGETVGWVEDIIYEGEYLVELKVKPHPTLDLCKFKKIGPYIGIPLSDVRLTNPFNDYVILMRSPW